MFQVGTIYTICLIRCGLQSNFSNAELYRGMEAPKSKIHLGRLFYDSIQPAQSTAFEIRFSGALRTIWSFLHQFTLCNTSKMLKKLWERGKNATSRSEYSNETSL